MGRLSALPTAAITDDSAVGGQIIQGSLIFDDDHETFFHRDMVGGNRKVWTLSYWTKLLNVDSTSSQRFWSAGDSGSGDVLKAEYYSGSTTRQIGFIDNNHAGSGIRFTTDAHIQDNAWYHIVMAVDTTVGTAANRVKIYINGELQTLWSSGSEHNHPPNQNYDTAMNKNDLGLAFGRAYAFGAGSATHFEGQMAELYLVDGQQLEATDFGYTESQTGIWRPKKFDRKGPNNGTTWSSNTSGNVYSGSAAGVFSGNLDANGINGNGDANNNHFTVSSINVIASKVGVRISNASSDVEVSVNGSVVGTIAQGNIATNIASRHTFTFSETTVNSVKVRRVGSSSGWFLYEIQLDDVPLINGNVSNMGQNGFYYPLDGSHHITKDLSGNGNDSIPYNLRGTVPLHMATGGLPILNTNKGGTVARPGVRPDPLASNIVLALPLSNRYQHVGTDVHHLIKGSGSPKTLTNNGSILGYFKSNFYNSSGSAYVANASSQNIGISVSDDFNMGTGDFTIECWIYPTTPSASDGSIFVTHDGGSNTNTYFAFNFSPSTGRFNIYLNTGSAAWSPAAEEGMIEYTKWNHVALVKHSNVVKLYVNGLSIGSYNHSGQVGYTAGNTTICRIGGGGSNSLNCYMQDMRIYKGVAKYTDTFTCAAIDSSVIPDSPSGIAVPRKFKRSISGSVGFDGTSDKITANSTDFVFGTDDFTIEATVFKTHTSHNGSNRAFIFGQTDNDAGGRSGVAFGYQNGGLWLLQGNGSTWNVETTVDVFPINQWVHVAVSKSSGTTKYFINGKLVYTYNTNINLPADNNGDISIGSINSTSMDWDGYISNFRIVKGTALYTSSFTPPSEPLTNVTNTKLLCCQDKYSVTAKAVGPTLSKGGNVYTSDFSPFDDDTISRASSYAYLNRSRNRKSGAVVEGSLFLHGDNYTLQTSTIVFGPGNITSGKYIWEIESSGGQGDTGMYAGITGEFNQSAGEIYSQANKTILSPLYHKFYNQTSTAATRTNQLEGTITFLLDVDNRELRGYYNTILIFTDTSIPNASTTQYAPFIFSTNDGASGAIWSDAHFNFGQRPFVFTPPEGYETISSSHIEPPSILNPKKHFDSIVYTPNSGGLTVTGLEFKPDFLWFKSRNQAYHNYVFDVVRGTGARSLRPSDTTPEPASGDATHVTTFLENGFYLNSASGINDNGSGTDGVVAWAWKGGSPEVATNGSIFCEGSADHITVSGHSDLDFGTGNFTIEGFFNADTQSNSTIICSRNYYTSGVNGNWLFRITNANSLAFASYDGNGNAEYSEFSFTYNKFRWYHFAVVREGTGSNQLKIYIDGTSIGSMTVSKSLSAGTTDVSIGEDLSGTNGEFKGYLSNIRIIKGTALYTSNFTPPSSPLTNVTNTKLLCCQSTTSATAAAVAPGSITAQGSVRTDLKNPFDAFMKDGVGYPTTSAAGITNGTQPLTGASINTKAGFSIVTYSGNADGNTTFGHGLSQAPEIFFHKSRDNTENWRVYYTTADGSYDFMYLNTAGAVNHSGYALPNATVINKADDSNESMVAYCWHSVPGYSKMGSYYGNGSTNGKFVYTGFKPAFILLKRHTDGSNYWEIRDNKRVTNNPNNERLFPNRNDTKSVGEGVDFYSNGFKIRNSGSGSNANDKIYIYMAFAEQPLTTQYGTQSNGE